MLFFLFITVKLLWNCIICIIKCCRNKGDLAFWCVCVCVSVSTRLTDTQWFTYLHTVSHPHKTLKMDWKFLTSICLTLPVPVIQYQFGPITPVLQNISCSCDWLSSRFDYVVCNVLSPCFWHSCSTDAPAALNMAPDTPEEQGAFELVKVRHTEHHV